MTSIPLQGSRLHFFFRVVTFPHPLPPPEGGGLVQVRVLVCSPLPQVVLHAENSDHWVNPPLTKMALNKAFKFYRLRHCQFN